jgi:hypothetical protein
VKVPFHELGLELVAFTVDHIVKLVLFSESVVVLSIQKQVHLVLHYEIMSQSLDLFSEIRQNISISTYKTYSLLESDLSIDNLFVLADQFPHDFDPDRPRPHY